MGKTNSKTIYKITVKNWEKYNSKKKKSHDCILLSTGFLSDAKILTLPPGGRLLYLGLLLRCGEVSATMCEASHDQLLTFAGGRGQVVSTLLSQLEDLQLVTVEKIEPFINRIEKKRKEKNRNEGESEFKNLETQETQETQKQAAVQIAKAFAHDSTKAVISKYCEIWKSKYGTNPPVGGKVAGQIKTLVKDHGVYRATQFIEAYLDMPDAWFITKRHDISTLLANLNAVAQFIETGRMFTKKEISNLDSSNSLRNTLEAIDRGEI